MLMHLLFQQTKGSAAKCMNLTVISEYLLHTLCESKDLSQSQIYMLLNVLTNVLCCKWKFPQHKCLLHTCDGNNYISILSPYGIRCQLYENQLLNPQENHRNSNNKMILSH